MPEPDDDHQQHVVLDCVDDSVVADPDTKAWSTLESTCAGRAWILGKKSDRTLDPKAHLRVELA